MIQYNFAKEFNPRPGKRFESLTPGRSGEKFRDEVLEKIFQENKKIVIDASEISNPMIPSFLDEAFGAIATKYGLDKFLESVDIFSKKDKEIKDDMLYYVNRRFNP
ncbi:STAS-like domain-containing protein [Francisella hispaniensis]|uniref:STAS-like domain-containing protein n=1 Tax=Francisella hispaniensis TaxID=622488 RepID=UPI000F500B88|nr:STAS-like domain-containing protein [Francisella hispaniensis]